MPEIGPMSYAEIGPMSVPRWPRSGRYWDTIVWLSGNGVCYFVVATSGTPVFTRAGFRQLVCRCDPDRIRRTLE